MEREHRSDRFTALEDQYAGYEVYDRNGEKIGKVDDLFVDENDRAEYLGVKMGFLGLEGTSLIPWELTRVDEQGRRIEISVDKAQVKEGPSFNDDEDITPQYENEVRSYYGVGGSSQESAELADRGAYGDYYGDEEELRVQRTEEELRVGTREREAGALGRGRRREASGGQGRVEDPQGRRRGRGGRRGRRPQGGGRRRERHQHARQKPRRWSRGRDGAARQIARSPRILTRAGLGKDWA